MYGSTADCVDYCRCRSVFPGRLRANLVVTAAIGPMRLCIERYIVCNKNGYHSRVGSPAGIGLSLSSSLATDCTPQGVSGR